MYEYCFRDGWLRERYEMRTLAIDLPSKTKLNKEKNNAFNKQQQKLRSRFNNGRK